MKKDSFKIKTYEYVYDYEVSRVLVSLLSKNNSLLLLPSD